MSCCSIGQRYPLTVTPLTTATKMPIATSVSDESLAPYILPSPTEEKLDWADLLTVDLSKFGTPEGNKALARTLLDAVRSQGFFYVENFDIPQQKVDRQFAIGQKFYNLPLEEKLNYVPDLDNGEYNGYRPAGRRLINPEHGIHDRVEVYNIPKFNGDFPRDHPEAVKEHIAEIEDFARTLHTKVLEPLLVLFAVALELPEDYFVKLHEYSKKSEDHLRYMKYGRYNEEETAKLNGIWTQGHTDLGSITLLFAQPVAALQIQPPSVAYSTPASDGPSIEDTSRDATWKWAKYKKGSLTVNTCDAFSFLTGGLVRSTVHRVSVPPKDQRNVDRLGLLYFARPHNDTPLATIQSSPVLQREGFTQNEFEKQGVPVPTMEEFVVRKQTWQQAKGRYERTDEEAEIVPGFKAKYFK